MDDSEVEARFGFESVLARCYGMVLARSASEAMALGYPVYVIDIDPRLNKVTLGPREQLFRKTLTANQLNLLQQRAIDATDGIRCQAKIRYNSDPEPAVLTRTGKDSIRLEFDEPQVAITPGQAVVCYDGDVVLGGGWIDGQE